jgi:hypothetical protein
MHGLMMLKLQSQRDLLSQYACLGPANTPTSSLGFLWSDHVSEEPVEMAGSTHVFINIGLNLYKHTKT